MINCQGLFMKRYMKLMLQVSLAAGLLAEGGSFALAGGCKNNDLKGGYVIAADGVIATPGGTLNVVQTGFVCRDGKGGVENGQFDTWNGQTLITTVVDSGSYTVNEDCTGIANALNTDGSETIFSFVVAKDKTVLAVSNTAGTALKAEVTGQAKLNAAAAKTN